MSDLAQHILTPPEHDPALRARRLCTALKLVCCCYLVILSLAGMLDPGLFSTLAGQTADHIAQAVQAIHSGVNLS